MSAREVNIKVVSIWRMPMLGDLNERAISLEEVGEAVNEIKSRLQGWMDFRTNVERKVVWQCWNG